MAAWYRQHDRWLAANAAVVVPADEKQRLGRVGGSTLACSRPAADGMSTERAGVLQSLQRVMAFAGCEI
jgi:hypothetical protein